MKHTHRIVVVIFLLLLSVPFLFPSPLAASVRGRNMSAVQYRLCSFGKEAVPLVEVDIKKCVLGKPLIEPKNSPNAGHPQKAGQTHNNGVNVANGNLDWKYHLYTLQNKCQDLPFSISFNPWTLDEVSSPMGEKAWPQFDTRLQFITAKYEKPNNVDEPSTSYDHLFEENQKFVFVKIVGLVNMTFYPNDEGEFYPEPGREGSLVCTGESYEFRTKFGRLYTFTYDDDHDIWNLDSIEDLNNNTIDFEYEQLDTFYSLSNLTRIQTDNVMVDLTYLSSSPIHLLETIKMKGENLQTRTPETKTWTFSYINNNVVDYIKTIKRPDNFTETLTISDTEFVLTDAKVDYPGLYSYSLQGPNDDYYDLNRVVELKEGQPSDNKTEQFVTTYSYIDGTTTVRDPRSTPWTYEYNDYGNVTTFTEPGSYRNTAIQTLMEWENMRLKKLTDPKNRDTEFEYDTNGNIIKESFLFEGNPQERKARFSPISLPQEMTDTKGLTRLFNYYSDKPTNLEMEEIKGYEKATFNYEYHDDGNLKNVKNKLGHITTYEYNKHGFQDHSDVSSKQNVESTYDAFGNLETQTVTIDDQKVLLRYDYDAMDRLLNVTRENISKNTDAVIAEYEYDGAGNKTLERDARGAETTYEYDDLNRLVQKSTLNETLVDGVWVAQFIDTGYEYDENGNLVEKTIFGDEGDDVTIIDYEYDEQNRLQFVIHDDNTLKEYTYDANDNIETYKNALPGHTTEYEYDELDRRSLTRTPDSAEYKMTYDTEGNLTGEETPLGVSYEYLYDDGYRLKDTNQTCDENNKGKKITRSMHYEYDNAGNLTSVTDYEDKETKYGYDDAERLHVITNVYNDGTRNLELETIYTLDDQGNRIQISDPEGRKVEYDYNDQGLVNQVSRFVTFGENLETVTTTYDYNDAGDRTGILDDEGNYTEFAYDQVGQLTMQKDPPPDDQNPELRPFQTFKYDARGNLVQQTDKNGSTTLNQYDEFSRLIKTEIPPDDIEFAGYEENYEYDDEGNLVKFYYDNENNSTIYAHDFIERKRTITDPTGKVAHFEYDEEGNTTVAKDKNNHTTLYDYDPRGLMVQVKDPENYTETYDYNGVGSMISHTDKNRNTETYEYDDLHRLEMIKQGTMTVKDFDYDNVGNILSVKDALENSIEYEYNEMDLRTAIRYGQDTRTGEEIRETFAYDHLGNMVEHLNADNKLTEYEYNPRNELARQIVRSDTTTRDQLNDIETTFAYDNNGNRTSVINPLGNATSYGFDRMNRLKQVTLPADSRGQSLVTSYSFDKRGNLIEQNFGGTITGFGYNPRNERITMTAKTTSMGDRTTHYEFDDNGNLDTLTRPNLDKVGYGYDGLNRLTTETNTPDPSGATQGKYSSLITYGHDGNGNQTSMTNKFSDESSQETITDYDTFDRPVSIDINGRKINKTYYDNGNLASEKDPAGRTSSYLYDGQNRMTQAMTPEGLTKYDHTPGGRLDTVTKPNGSKTSYFYDFADRVSSINTTDRSGLPVSNFGYDYDKNSNRTLQSVGFQNETPVETIFGYDTQDRLETSTRGTKITNFGYDTQGNRTSLEVKENGTTVDNTIYNYDEHKQLVSTQNSVNPVTNQSFEYDPNGNMIQRTQGANTENWEYSPRNQPIGYYRNNEPNPTESYTYDELGMRNAKINHQDNQTTNYLHDGRRIIQESDTNGNPIRNYRYGNGLIGYNANGLPQFTHTDPLGSITAITSSDGTLLESRKYDPFGASDVVGGAAFSLSNVKVTHEDAIMGLSFHTIDAIVPGDDPAEGPLDVTGPNNVAVGDIWYPEIVLTINDDGDPDTEEVTIPVHQVPLTMLSDLSPPFVQLDVDQKYLTENGQLNYTLSTGFDENLTITDAQFTIELPEAIEEDDIWSDYPFQFDEQTKILTWSIDDFQDPANPPSEILFSLELLYEEHANTIFTLEAGLIANNGDINRVSNQIYTAFMTKGLAFFAVPRMGGTGGIKTAYVFDAMAYYTDFLCTIVYMGEESTNTRSFIAKETDNSTGLTDFGIRLYDENLARFTSGDPLLGEPFLPRSHLRYSYGFNNPFSFIDLFGFQSKYLWQSQYVDVNNKKKDDLIQIAEELCATLNTHFSRDEKEDCDSCKELRNCITDVKNGTIDKEFLANKIFNISLEPLEMSKYGTIIPDEPTPVSPDSKALTIDQQIYQQKTVSRRIVPALKEAGTEVIENIAETASYLSPPVYFGKEVYDVTVKDEPIDPTALALPLVFKGKSLKKYRKGTFSLTKISWAGYPTGIPRPSGTLRLLKGAEYQKARKAADRANAALRRANPKKYTGKQIHEIKPVKYGGSPTDPANKIALTPNQHYQYNAFWRRLQIYLEKYL